MKPQRLALIALILTMLACNLIESPPAQPVSAVTSVPTIQAATLPTITEAASVPTLEPTTSPIPHADFGRIAREHVEALTTIGARVSGSANEMAAGQYILDTFTRLGYLPLAQSFSAWDEDENEFTSHNVIAVKQGSSSKQIIIGAHYDSGDEGLGADDNASGVGIMLETAEQIANLETPYTVVFVAFGSEENDLDGSYYYVELMSQTDRDNTIAYVNLDSLAAGDITYVYSDEGEDAFLRDWVLDWAGSNNLPLQTIPNVDLTSGGEYFSDYGAFKDRGILFIYFEATNWTLGDQDGYTQVDLQYGDQGFIWHTQYDNLTYLDATFPGRVDEHMRIFVSALVAICTEFKL